MDTHLFYRSEKLGLRVDGQGRAKLVEGKSLIEIMSERWRLRTLKVAVRRLKSGEDRFAKADDVSLVEEIFRSNLYYNSVNSRALFFRSKDGEQFKVKLELSSWLMHLLTPR